MSNEKLEMDLVNFANALEAAAVDLKHRIAERHGVNVKEEPTKAEKPTLNEINSLKSVGKTSDKGEYQLIHKSENQGNSAFQKLQSYIKEHNGFVILHGFKAWIFSNDPENKIGLRKQ